MMHRHVGIVLGFCLLALSSTAQAQVVTESVDYKHGEALLESFLSYDDANTDKRPGVLVVHEWKGLGEYAKRRAEMMASEGYMALAVDMYGKGVRPQTHEEAAVQAGIYKSDRALMRARIQAAMDVLKAHPLVNPEKIAVIGYCFGGTTALELARSGADIKGAASFHGALSTPNVQDAKNIKAKVLVCHGAADTYVPAEEVEAFKKEMTDAGVDMRFESYEGAVHSFTVPEAGDDPSKGAAYNAAADQKSWATLLEFLKQVFA